MAYTDVCGSKLRKKLGATFNETAAQKISKTSFAAKQMEKMGWTEGSGLGKRGEGIVSHIKVKQREESVGLGREKEMTREIGNTWWNDSVAQTLLKLQQKKSKKDGEKKEKKKRKKSKDKKKTSGDNKGIGSKSEKRKRKRSGVEQDEDKKIFFTDQELFEATGGARFGMRAQRRAEGKWKRTEKASSLKEWEDEVVKNGTDWNGLGSAKIILNSSPSVSTGTRDKKYLVNAYKDSDDNTVNDKKTEGKIDDSGKNSIDSRNHNHPFDDSDVDNKSKISEKFVIQSNDNIDSTPKPKKRKQKKKKSA
mmetsp:Transcript_8444/g.12040  ORF Transcript_8444/g.12040 Transcript_8444/m.12040 type:complete len:307 (-) Transcript_8444:259-1179(-)|eukprot:CAMPEP_0184862180 /NCGR_PEP_ID=MMETSP0580-20130426/6680_1 /TAXON_ID=1118495 /ORGANISM="Dactyliosolen fragilissimus" /LENGTH=306 /DNA_ID=CAMNT_0027359927 /DNA_START=115 /DNA_END=1035 /DNA_ORIENTATION=+